MDMMEMMDDQRWSGSLCFLLLFASLLLCWVLLDFVPLSLYGTMRRGTPVRCSQQQSALWTVDDMYLSALQQ